MNLQEIQNPSMELVHEILQTDPYVMITAADDAYGFSAAYRINGKHYVVIDDGSYTSYFLLSSKENVTKKNLYQLLENNSLSGIDFLLQKAGIYGIENIPQAKPDDEGPFWLFETRYIYDSGQRTYVHSGPYETFEEAKQAMAEAYEHKVHPVTKIPVLAHDEYAAPLYTIISE